MTDMLRGLQFRAKKGEKPLRKQMPTRSGRRKDREKNYTERREKRRC